MPEHYLASIPLLESEDEIIREGAMMLFAIYYSSLEREAQQEERYRWTSFQWSKRILKRTLEPRREEFQSYMNLPRDEREQIIQKFRSHTRRWI